MNHFFQVAGTLLVFFVSPTIRFHSLLSNFSTSESHTTPSTTWDFENVQVFSESRDLKVFLVVFPRLLRRPPSQCSSSQRKYLQIRMEFSRVVVRTFDDAFLACNLYPGWFSLFLFIGQAVVPT